MTPLPSPAGAAPTGRLVALDVFRGLTVALMILVNNPGSWAHVHPPLRHADWRGLTPTDLVFPFFLFIVGAAMALSFARRQAAGADRTAMLRKVGARTAIIFASGLLLNAFPFGLPLSREAAATFTPGAVAASLHMVRLMGVLQRIAVCYGSASLILVGLPTRRARTAAALAVLGLYEAAMRLPLVDGWGAGSFGPEDSFARWLDLEVLGADRLWQGSGIPFEPEGLLSSLPAVVTVLLGHAAGTLLLGDLPLHVKIRRLAGAGVVAAGAGLLLGRFEPVIKQLWTVSYTIATAGLAALALALCLWLVDARGWRRATRPAVIFGMNPLVAFVGSGLLARVVALVRVADGGDGSMSLRAWLYHQWCVPVAGEVNGSLLYAAANVALWLAVLWGLDRRGWYVKI